MDKGDSIERVIAGLRAARANTSCKDMARLLKQFGFTVRNGKRGGHKVFFHQGIKNFVSNYDCGHGRNPTLKKTYVMKIIRVLEKYESELRKYTRVKK